MYDEGSDGGLLGLPFVPVCLGGTRLLAKSHFGDGGYRILLSDTQSVWEEEVDMDTIQSRAQELNKRLRASVSAFFSHLQAVAQPCLSGERDGRDDSPSFTILTIRPDRLVLRLKSELAGVPFYWEFRCTSTPVTVVCSHLVRPLLAINVVLQKQIEQLGALLSRKDAEIQDYKESGAVLSRGRLQTEVFDEEHYQTRFIQQTLPKLCTENLGFSATLQELYVAVTAQSVKQLKERSEREHTEDTINSSDANRQEEMNDGTQHKQEVCGVEPAEANMTTPVEESQNQQTETRNPVNTTVPVKAPPRPKKRKAVGLFR